MVFDMLCITSVGIREMDFITKFINQCWFLRNFNNLINKINYFLKIFFSA